MSSPRENIGPNILLVVAVRNEEENMLYFVDRINSLFIPDVTINILFIEDGSTDKTLTVLKSMKTKAENIDYTSLINPFGQGLALAWGIARGKADAVITIDVDGSHPIEIIKQMIEQYRQGLDVVQGIRVEYRRDSWYRQIASRIYFFIFSVVTGIDLQKQNVHFRLMNKKACGIFIRNQPWWYSLRTNFSRRDNIKTSYIPFIAPERTTGNSKYHFRRLFLFAFKSFLTLTKPKRFIVLLLLGLILTYLIYSVNLWFSVICLIFLIFLMFIYLKNRFTDYSTMVKENSPR